MSASLQALLARKLHTPTLHLQPVGGGSINQTFRISTGAATYFCKVNSATKFPHLFQKEAKGLQLLRQHNTIRIPEVVDCFELDDQQVLLLEWIESGRRTTAFWKTFGAQLAALHHVHSDHHGLDHDNYMGSVEQNNTPGPDWNAFFVQRRLQPLVQRCTRLHLLNSKHQQQFERLYEKLPYLFAEEPPALLHGDLWSGNFMCDEAAQPVLIDPALYYGHRSMDLAMTTLFGGFDASFYEAYHYHYALPSNYADQWKVCNLYPLLIHLYLFGSGYLPQIQATLNEFAWSG